ncbi:putative carbon starvation protein [Escherichia coli]|uniref:Putative carbon starvation protein n=1 Tax=Escherichia coli TaxID=562 RepID=A0A377AQL9_ECOLX|nr:putative carbon starvation protein [Escherichia coli]
MDTKKLFKTHTLGDSRNHRCILPRGSCITSGGARQCPVDRVASVSVYLVAYRYYSLYIAQKVMKLDPTRATPAVINNDGLNYVPTNRYVLFGHHFAAIAVRVRWLVRFSPHRWVTCLVPVAAGGGSAGRCGTGLYGAVISSRRNGASLGEMIKEEMGPVPGLSRCLAVS